MKKRLRTAGLTSQKCIVGYEYDLYLKNHCQNNKIKRKTVKSQVKGPPTQD